MTAAFEFKDTLCNIEKIADLKIECQILRRQANKNNVKRVINKIEKKELEIISQIGQIARKYPGLDLETMEIDRFRALFYFVQVGSPHDFQLLFKKFSKQTILKVQKN